MKVGALEETVTVTGASPVVDVQNVRTQQVLKPEVLEALPSGRRDLTQLASLTLGATASTQGRNDVGGDKARLNTAITLHGSRGDDGSVNYDGMNTNCSTAAAAGSSGSGSSTRSACRRRSSTPAARAPRPRPAAPTSTWCRSDGGNVFSVHSVANYTNSGSWRRARCRTTSLPAAARPIRTSMKKVYDYGVGIGGPIMQDRLWFYKAQPVVGRPVVRREQLLQHVDGLSTLRPDLTRPAYTRHHWQRDFGGRFTWQATPKHKITRR